MSCQLGSCIAAHMLKRQTADKKAHGETDSAESGHPEHMLKVCFLRNLRYLHLYCRHGEAVYTDKLANGQVEHDAERYLLEEIADSHAAQRDTSIGKGKNRQDQITDPGMQCACSSFSMGECSGSFLLVRA